MSAEAGCLQLDVGNSSAKWRLLRHGAICNRGLYRPQDRASEDSLLSCAETLGQIWISSVASEEADRALGNRLRERWSIEPWFARSEARRGALVNSYAEPERMGVDRWLAMVAARELFAERRLCVVDAGSALTIDLVAADGQHEGGYIIPGPQLMERALLLDTGRVRFSETAQYALEPGCSTATAVRHGLALAQAGAVALALRVSAGKNGEAPYPVFTGGGGEWLWRELGGDGRVEPDLVLDGLQAVATQSAPLY